MHMHGSDSAQRSKGWETCTESGTDPRKSEHRTTCSLRLARLIASWNKKLNILQRFTTEPRVYIAFARGESRNHSILKEAGKCDLFSRKGKKMSAASSFRHWNDQMKARLQADLIIMHREINAKSPAGNERIKKYKTIKGYLFSLKFHKFPHLLVCVCSLCSFIKLLIFYCAWNYSSFYIQNLFACSHLFYAFGRDLAKFHCSFLKHSCCLFNAVNLICWSFSGCYCYWPLL